MIVGGEQAGQVDRKIGQVVEGREKDQGQLSEEADRKVLPIGEDGDQVEDGKQKIVDGQGKKEEKEGGKVRFLMGKGKAQKDLNCWSSWAWPRMPL